MGWVQAIVHSPLANKRLPSITAAVHAADWHEREAEDHFGLVFEGHPRLGDFVLHDDRWQEGLEPMRRSFNGRQAVAERQPNLNWRPRPIVHAPGSFMMPIGPVFAGISEPVHFLLETVGEDVIHTIPRLFYKYRGVEKVAEGRTVDDALALAERFCGTSAFAHGLAILPGGREDRPHRRSAAGAAIAGAVGGTGAISPSRRRHRSDLPVHGPGGGRQSDGNCSRRLAAVDRTVDGASLSVRYAPYRRPDS